MTAPKRTPLARLKPSPWNPRHIKDERFENLCRSIQADPDFLRLRPILAQSDGTIYAGNMRWRAAKHLGMSEVWAIVEDVSEQLAKERALRDNAGWGENVDDQVGALLAELKEAGSDIDLLGFESAELDRLLGSVTQLAEEDEADLEPPAEPITKPGDLWLLGEHRLLCGDSTNITDVERLMNGQRARLGLSDPPYNVGESYSTFDDHQGESEYEQFCRDWFVLLVASTDRQIVTPGCYNLARWCRYFEPYHTAPWTKSNSMTNGKVARWWCWEPVMFFGDKWPRKRSNDIFEFAIGQQKDVGDHPCPKPLSFWLDLVEHYSERGDGVLDLFGGAGTTLMACEQLGRCAYLMEMDPDPRYVDVAVARWEKLTGKTAVRETEALRVAA